MKPTINIGEHPGDTNPLTKAVPTEDRRVVGMTEKTWEGLFLAITLKSAGINLGSCTTSGWVDRR
jgi:hypothetical protein